MMDNVHYGSWWNNLLRGKNCKTRFVYNGEMVMPLINRLEHYLHTPSFLVDRMFDMKHEVEKNGCTITYEHKED